MKRLSELEAERRAELRAAKRFIDTEGVGNLPGARTDTGESAGRQTVGHNSNPTVATQPTVGDLPRRHRDDLSYSGYESLDDFEQALIQSGTRYNPLVGGGEGHPTLDSLEKRSRMNHVFSFMDEDRVNLLFEHFVEGRTLADIAADTGVSKQAVSKRVKVAVEDFQAAFADHWNDDVTWEV